MQGNVLAQEPVFRHFSTPEGLPSPETYMVMEDRKGYMWISTDHGASRFDGYQFTNFTTDDGLNGNTVFGTYEDYKGRIWFYTFRGGLSYLEGDSILNPVKGAPMENWKGMSVPFSMYVDTGDTVWLGLRRTFVLGQFIKVFPDGTFRKTILPGGKDGFIKRFSSGGYFINGAPMRTELSKLSLIDAQNQVKYYSDKVKIDSSYSSSFTAFQKPDGSIIFVYSRVLAEWNKGSISILDTLHYATNLGLFEDSNKNVWVSRAKGGVAVYRNRNFRDPPQLWLKDRLVSWITEDSEGGIWVSTLNDGIYYTPSVDVLALPGEKYFGNKRVIHITGKADTLLVTLKNGEVTRLVYRANASLDTLTKPV
ncbi:MAG: ligand-binding sensor domain-containing protein, partial [Owenweeksia sp.]